MDDWALWRAQLAGKDTSDIPVSDGTIYAGYWHLPGPDWERVAIWKADGRWSATVGTKRADPARTLERVLHRKKGAVAVSYDAYIANLKHGTPWPAQAALERAEAERAAILQADPAEAVLEPQGAGLGHNLPPTDLTPDTELYEQIVELGRTFRAEQKRIEMKPELRAAEDTYVFMSKISAKALELFKEGDGKRVVEKDPHLKACREVDAKWGRVTKLADELKRLAVEMTEPYLKWQAQEAAKAKRAMEENREAMTKAGVALPAMDTGRGRPKPAGAKLVTREKVEFTDLPAFAAYLAAFKSPPADFVALCSTIAMKLVANHVPDIPGIKIVTTQEARN